MQVLESFNKSYPNDSINPLCAPHNSFNGISGFASQRLQCAISRCQNKHVVCPRQSTKSHMLQWLQGGMVLCQDPTVQGKPVCIQLSSCNLNHCSSTALSPVLWECVAMCQASKRISKGPGDQLACLVHEAGTREVADQAVQIAQAPTIASKVPCFIEQRCMRRVEGTNVEVITFPPEIQK